MPPALTSADTDQTGEAPLSGRNAFRHGTCFIAQDAVWPRPIGRPCNGRDCPTGGSTYVPHPCFTNRCSSSWLGASGQRATGHFWLLAVGRHFAHRLPSSPRRHPRSVSHEPLSLWDSLRRLAAQSSFEQVLHAQVTAPYPPARANPGAIDSIPQSRSCHLRSPAGRLGGRVVGSGAGFTCAVAIHAPPRPERPKTEVRLWVARSSWLRVSTLWVSRVERDARFLGRA